MAPKVVILGAGFGGVALAKGLSGVADVVIVDKKDYFDVNYASPRAFVEPELADKITIPYKNARGLGTFVGATAVKLNKDSVELSDGRVLPFDYAVVATGSTVSDSTLKGHAPTAEERKSELKEASEKISSARHVLVVGGGASGLEVAGEILTAFPGKKLTLVHSGGALLERTTKPSPGVNALKWLKSKGATVILNDKVVSEESGTYLTKSGQRITADLVFYGTGATPNTELLRENFASSLDNAGLVKVDEYLRVAGSQNIFAVGDVTNVQESKLAFLAGKHGELVAKNIVALIKSGHTAKLKAWKPGMGMPGTFLLVSLGKKYAVGQMGQMTVSGWIPTMLKSKGTYKLVDHMQKELGVGK